MKTAIKNFLGKARRFFSEFVPMRSSMKWAAMAIFIAAALFLGISFFFMLRPIGIVDTLIFFMAFGLLAVLGALLIDLLLTWFFRLPVVFRIAILAALPVFMFLFGNSRNFAFLSLVLVVFFASMAGISLYNLRKRREEAGRLRTGFRIALLVVGLAGLFGFSWWLFDPGQEAGPQDIAALAVEYRPELVNLANPCEPGYYNYSSLSYGNGKDKRRPEFGQQASIVTTPVDGSDFLEGWKKWGGKLRSRFFGFDASELPLNGRVWLPEGDGPFPLVLVVHGNHFAADYSDPGYAYLGEHWASRGIITVSVDQNFLNGSHTNIFGGLGKENNARGWLLLKHLEQWRQWNQDPESPFYQMVDMDNIVLVGHSRGGEAVGHAAFFNSLPFYPDNARQVFDFGFNIRGIIAIAPVDGQYQPGSIRPALKDINYLSIQGSHDADMRSFDGVRMFERLQFSEDSDNFAALVYIYRANHGQFNTVWGRKDFMPPAINLYNIRQLISQEDQLRIGLFFMTAFLEVTFARQPGYRCLFKDYRHAGDWLPQTTYLTSYKDARMRPVVNFQEDINLGTTSIAGGRISASNLSDWYESRIATKWSPLETRGVYLGWEQQDEDTGFAEYVVEFPAFNASGKTLYLFAADTGNNPRSKEKEKEEQESSADDNPDEVSQPQEDSGGEQAVVQDEEEEHKFIDFTIELLDVNGECISFPLSSFSFLQPKIEARLAKLDMLHPQPLGESVLQLFYFPVHNFQYQNPWFDPEQLKSVRIRFDRSEKGVIVMSELGFF